MFEKACKFSSPPAMPVLFFALRPCATIASSFHDHEAGCPNPRFRQPEQYQTQRGREPRRQLRQLLELASPLALDWFQLGLQFEQLVYVGLQRPFGQLLHPFCKRPAPSQPRVIIILADASWPRMVIPSQAEPVLLLLPSVPPLSSDIKG